MSITLVLILLCHLFIIYLCFVMSSLCEGATTLKPLSRLWLTDLWQGNPRPDSLDTLLHPGWSFSEKTKSLAGHRCWVLAKHGWQQLPLCGQRVTLGDMLFWGDTVSLPAEEIRGVSWPRSQRGWCVLSKHLVQDKNAGYKHRPTLRRWSHCFPITPEQAWERRAVPLWSWAAGSPRALF